jgi:hypothetical protein
MAASRDDSLDKVGQMAPTDLLAPFTKLVAPGADRPNHAEQEELLAKRSRSHTSEHGDTGIDTTSTRSSNTAGPSPYKFQRRSAIAHGAREQGPGSELQADEEDEGYSAGSSSAMETDTSCSAANGSKEAFLARQLATARKESQEKDATINRLEAQVKELEMQVRREKLARQAASTSSEQIAALQLEATEAKKKQAAAESAAGSLRSELDYHREIAIERLAAEQRMRHKLVEAWKKEAREAQEARKALGVELAELKKSTAASKPSSSSSLSTLLKHPTAPVTSAARYMEEDEKEPDFVEDDGTDSSLSPFSTSLHTKTASLLPVSGTTKGRGPSKTAPSKRFNTSSSSSSFSSSFGAAAATVSHPPVRAAAVKAGAGIRQNLADFSKVKEVGSDNDDDSDAEEEDKDTSSETETETESETESKDEEESEEDDDFDEDKHLAKRRKKKSLALSSSSDGQDIVTISDSDEDEGGADNGDSGQGADTRESDLKPFSSSSGASLAKTPHCVFSSKDSAPGKRLRSINNRSTSTFRAEQGNCEGGLT